MIYSAERGSSPSRLGFTSGEVAEDSGQKRLKGLFIRV